MTGFLIVFVNLFFEILTLAIFARIMLSWIQVDPYNRLVQMLYQVTEPILAPFRRIVPPLGMIDISPIVVLLVLRLAQSIAVSIIVSL